MNKKAKEIKPVKDNSALQAGLTGGFIIILLLGIATFYPKYDNDHPVYCEKEAIVKEIVSIKGKTAIVKIDDGTLVDTPTLQYDSVEKINKRDISIGGKICLSYERK